MGALIEVAGVAKAFGGVRALAGCELEVEEGSIAGLIGPNGSGKTTLFNVITGYERPSAGEVRLRGRPITGLRPDRIFRLGVGRTFQITRLFGRLTVEENMLVAVQRHEGWLRGVARRAGSRAERGRARELLDFVGLAPLARAPAAELSYGQRKLLELASLLVADPSVLLLDEPAGGVNPTLIGQLADRIRELNRAGRTFLVVEHNMEFVMGLCDRVTVLSEGRTLAVGAPSAVRTDPAVLDAYLGGAGAAAPARPRSGAGEPLLSLHGVSAGYGGGDILHDVSLAVPEGEITCVVGPNGAGKSTLLKTVSGLLRPRTGDIRFRGRSLAGMTPRRILGLGLAQIPQAHSLFADMTVLENVEMGAFTVADRALVRRRLAAVQELFPIVRERAHEKAGSLSGGQQRLVEIARCLMLEPALIALDEPSMGLDPHTRELVFATIERLNAEGRTILLVEQNARAGLQLSSRGVVMENGRVRLTGSGRDVLEHPEIGALYLGGAARPAQATGRPDALARARSGARSSSLAGPAPQADPNGPAGTP
jgi:ABC-type branched-subunit amino acid transport system ATPase component